MEITVSKIVMRGKDVIKKILLFLLVICCGCAYSSEEKKLCTNNQKDAKDEIIFTIKDKKVTYLQWEMERKIANQNNKLTNKEVEEIKEKILDTYSFNEAGISSKSEIIDLKLYVSISVDFQKLEEVEDFTKLSSLEIDDIDNINYSKLSKQLERKKFTCE